MAKAMQSIGLVPKPPKPQDPARMPIDDEAARLEREREKLRTKKTGGRESTRLAGDYGSSILGK